MKTKKRIFSRIGAVAAASVLALTTIVAAGNFTVTMAADKNPSKVLVGEDAYASFTADLSEGRYKEFCYGWNKTADNAIWRVVSAIGTGDSYKDSQGNPIGDKYYIRTVQAKEIPGQSAFNQTGTQDPGAYQGSVLQKAMKDFGSSAVFDPREAAIAVQTTKDEQDKDNFAGSPLKDDQFFALSAQEVLYSYTNDRSRIAELGDTPNAWWTRTESKEQNDQIVFIDKDGVVQNNGAYDDATVGVRPAANIDLSKVLFTMAAGEPAPGANDGLVSVAGNQDTARLTIQDDALTVSPSADNIKALPGSTASLSYAGFGKTGSNIFLSAMILDATGAVAFYGKIAQPNNSRGMAMFTVPADLPANQTYDMYVFAEEEHNVAGTEGAGFRTNYASALKKVTLQTSADVVVTFDVQGHGTAPDAQSVAPGSKVTKPADPMAEGFAFKGWFKDAACTEAWDFDNDTVSENTTLFAKWEETDQYTVTFNMNGHGTAPEPQMVSPGGKVTRPKDPTAEGVTFGGWFKESQCIEPWDFDNDTVNASTTIFAKWTQVGKCTVTFNMNGHGVAPDPQTVNVGGKITKPKDPTADGFVFGGWFKEPQAVEAWNFEKDTVTANTTIFAKWTSAGKYTVAFNMNGHGTAPQSQTVETGGRVTKPTPDPTAVGYTFGGWFKEPQCTTAWDFEKETIAANTTIFAKWVPNVYTIKFDANGALSGTVPESMKVNYGDDVTLPANTGKLVLDGFTFAGWNTKADGTGKQFAEGAIVKNAALTDKNNGEVTLFAQWKEHQNKIVEGDKINYVMGSGEGASVRIDADIKDFEAVFMDGVLVDPTNYDVKSGSTIIEFKDTYLASLPEGEHVAHYLFTNGFANSTINVVPAGQQTTGFNWIILVGCVAGAALIAIIIIVIVRKNKTKKA